jgi:hypothetical protein
MLQTPTFLIFVSEKEDCLTQQKMTPDCGSRNAAPWKKTGLIMSEK